MTKVKVLMITLIIVMTSGLFYASYGATRKSTDGDARYNEMWEALEEHADGMSGTSKFNPATCDITYAKKWIEFFEIQDFTKDKLEVYRKDCIEILGKLQTNLDVLGASDGEELLNRINKIDEYVIKTWKLEKDEIKTLNPELVKDNSESLEIIEEKEKNKDVAIYTNPKKNESKTSASSLDDMISDAETFAKRGDLKYEEDALKNFSTILFNCFLAVGVAIALVVGIIIGIKYMMGSIEEKAQYKEMLLPYVVGCLIVFGAFGIWKVVVIILESI